MKHDIALTVNGRLHQLTLESQRTLLEVLRDELKLFGTRESCGITSFRSSSRLAPNSWMSSDTPVVLPPGRARFETNPDRIGSPTPVRIIGTVRVACCAARAGSLPNAAITSTLSRAS